MINYLINQSVSVVEIVGLDGYQAGKNNYSYDETNVIHNDSLFIELNQIVNSSLQALKSLIDIKLITPSIYKGLP